MTTKPTGRLRGDDLVLTRTFAAPIDDVWTSLTQSESTARWFGPWERVVTSDGAADEKRIRVQMIQEEGKPWMDATIEACEAPRLLTLRTSDGQGEWLLSLHLAESAGITTLELVHHGVKRNAVGEIGPGWEFYLDLLVASREEKPLPKFDAYYPSQKEYFTALA